MNLQRTERNHFTSKPFVNETHKSLELYILLGNAAMSDEYPGGIEPQPIKLEFKIYPAELWI